MEYHLRAYYLGKATFSSIRKVRKGLKLIKEYLTDLLKAFK